MKTSEKCLGERKTLKDNAIKTKTTFLANLWHLKKTRLSLQFCSKFYE